MDSHTLLREIETAAAGLGITPATLCQRSVLNSHIPNRLAAGGSVTVRTLSRIRDYVAARRGKQSTDTIVNKKRESVNKPLG